jgi:general secretion pathway protein I
MATLLVKNYRKRHSISGMTLIEVLIALAIIAIAMTAIIKAVSENIRATNHLQNKTMALWVGESVLNEARLGLIKFPSRDEKVTHTLDLLGRDWYWQGGQEETPNKRIRKITVSVYMQNPENDESMTPIIELDSYVYREE